MEQIIAIVTKGSVSCLHCTVILSFSMVVFRVCYTLTLFRMGLFGAAHGWGGDKKAPSLNNTYPTMIKLGMLITYLKKIQKIYKSRDTTH